MEARNYNNHHAPATEISSSGILSNYGYPSMASECSTDYDNPQAQQLPVDSEPSNNSDFATDPNNLRPIENAITGGASALEVEGQNPTPFVQYGSMVAATNPVSTAFDDSNQAGSFHSMTVGGSMPYLAGQGSFSVCSEPSGPIDNLVVSYSNAIDPNITSAANSIQAHVAENTSVYETIQNLAAEYTCPPESTCVPENSSAGSLNGASVSEPPVVPYTSPNEITNPSAIRIESVPEANTWPETKEDEFVSSSLTCLSVENSSVKFDNNPPKFFTESVNGAALSEPYKKDVAPSEVQESMDILTPEVAPSCREALSRGPPEETTSILDHSVQEDENINSNLESDVISTDNLCAAVEMVASLENNNEGYPSDVPKPITGESIEESEANSVALRSHIVVEPTDPSFTISQTSTELQNSADVKNSISTVDQNCTESEKIDKQEAAPEVDNLKESKADSENSEMNTTPKFTDHVVSSRPADAISSMCFSDSAESITPKFMPPSSSVFEKISVSEPIENCEVLGAVQSMDVETAEKSLPTNNMPVTAELRPETSEKISNVENIVEPINQPEISDSISSEGPPNENVTTAESVGISTLNSSSPNNTALPENISVTGPEKSSLEPSGVGTAGEEVTRNEIVTSEVTATFDCEISDSEAASAVVTVSPQNLFAVVNSSNSDAVECADPAEDTLTAELTAPAEEETTLVLVVDHTEISKDSSSMECYSPQDTSEVDDYEDTSGGENLRRNAEDSETSVGTPQTEDDDDMECVSSPEASEGHVLEIDEDSQHLEETETECTRNYDTAKPVDDMECASSSGAVNIAEEPVLSEPEKTDKEVANPPELPEENSLPECAETSEYEEDAAVEVITPSESLQTFSAETHEHDDYSGLPKENTMDIGNTTKGNEPPWNDSCDVFVTSAANTLTSTHYDASGQKTIVADNIGTLETENCDPQAQKVGESVADSMANYTHVIDVQVSHKSSAHSSRDVQNVFVLESIKNVLDPPEVSSPFVSSENDVSQYSVDEMKDDSAAAITVTEVSQPEEHSATTESPLQGLQEVPQTDDNAIKQSSLEVIEESSQVLNGFPQPIKLATEIVNSFEIVEEIQILPQTQENTFASHGIINENFGTCKFISLQPKIDYEFTLQSPIVVTKVDAPDEVCPHEPDSVEEILPENVTYHQMESSSVNLMRVLRTADAAMNSSEHATEGQETEEYLDKFTSEYVLPAGVEEVPVVDDVKRPDLGDECWEGNETLSYLPLTSVRQVDLVTLEADLSLVNLDNVYSASQDENSGDFILGMEPAMLDNPWEPRALSPLRSKLISYHTLLPSHEHRIMDSPHLLENVERRREVEEPPKDPDEESELILGDICSADDLAKSKPQFFGGAKPKISQFIEEDWTESEELEAQEASRVGDYSYLEYPKPNPPNSFLTSLRKNFQSKFSVVKKTPRIILTNANTGLFPKPPYLCKVVGCPFVGLETDFRRALNELHIHYSAIHNQLLICEYCFDVFLDGMSRQVHKYLLHRTCKSCEVNYYEKGTPGPKKGVGKDHPCIHDKTLELIPDPPEKNSSPSGYKRKSNWEDSNSSYKRSRNDDFESLSPKVLRTYSSMHRTYTRRKRNQ